MRQAASSIVVVAVSLALSRGALASTLPPRFEESTVLSGFSYPTVVKFAPDGRVFVAEKSGLIKAYATLEGSNYTILADLRPRVQDFWDRGLLGMELDPAFPTRPYVYVLYALDKNPADITATIPTWGDMCPTPPGATASGCPVLGRLSRLDVSAPWPVQATEHVLLEGFPQQFPSHSVGGLAFAPDGALLVSAGEGASFTLVDYGQLGGSSGPGPGQSVPPNPLGDPPGGVGSALTPPQAEGGALRSQSLRRAPGEPVVLSGVVLRVDPNTGEGLPDNPRYSDADANARRIVAYGLRNPFRLVPRPGTREVWVGDVGWNDSEEINRIDLAVGGPPNFGWPCYEGLIPQGGYQAAGLSTCQSLYAEGSARPPFWSYQHSGQVVPGETCPIGTSSISGLAFYTSGNYPTALNGALFFTDWARHCIWAMLPGATGQPDPARIITFASGLSGGAVHLEAGPEGDIFYADFDGGRIQRIRYFPLNQPPQARASANPTGGPTPLLVQLDGSTSSDPDGEELTYGWDLDGDGAFDDSTLVNPTYTFTTSGKHTVRLEVRDPWGAASTAAVDVFADNQPPHATITAPSGTLTWKVGDLISFAGTGTDPEEGTLGASALTFSLLLHHCPAECHVHTVQSWPGVAAGSFNAPDHEYPSWVELRLTVTDSGGLSDTASVALMPQTVVVTFETSPPGLVLAANGGASPTPFSHTYIVGSANTISAPSPQPVTGDDDYGFRSWSDGGAATHILTAPPAATTLVATYRPLADLELTQTASPDPSVAWSRVTVTATIENHGPHAASEVQLVEALPAGTTLLSTSPPGVCTPLGPSLTCAVPNLPVGGSSVVTLILRPSRAGASPLTATVASYQADVNLADNSVTGNLNVRPVGDVSADGKEDLLWQSSATAMVAGWTMDGATYIASVALAPDRGPDRNWRLGGLADLDLDGRSDFVWRNQATGVDEIWLMEGMTRKSVVALPTVPDTGLQIVSVADFNGDGWADLLWRHRTTGVNFVVFMNGTTPMSVAYLPTVNDTTWEIVGTADLNGDAKPDVLWRRGTDGLNFAWLMNGVTVTSGSALLSPADVNWRISSVADLNGDGKPDLVLRHRVSGIDIVVFLDGLNPTGLAALPQVLDTAWAIVGPR
ncbi:MAG: PQQ-dependent sugar dehydrogenase [Solirubrobacterales bacterium]